MGLILSPEPSIVTGSILTINITKQSDVESYAITSNGIPPVIAKYIAYDNLSPANPFIATVEDGLGNILLDGGFPKWYNTNCNTAWASYADLSPSFKYLYDAIDFISNKTKVNAGNKKILILGDHLVSDSYAIKSTIANGFKTSIDKICTIKGYTPTYIDCADYDNVVLNPSYSLLDQYCCVLFFSTSYTNIQKISNVGIASLIAYRESGNGIFVITDHGDRELTNIADAAGTTLNYSGFYRTANYLVTNFGCYFSGNYNRSPVNVGFLRANYGNHILWNNLADTDYISAGGSESKVVVTEYPLYTGNHSITLTSDGYHSIKVLTKLTNGSLGIATYTYGKNVPEIIYFQKEDETNYTSSEKRTFIRTHQANIKIDYSTDASGLLKKDLIPIGTFSFSKANNQITKSFSTGFTNSIKIENDHMFYVQITNPLNYTKGLRIIFDKPNFNIRTSKVLNHINANEFKLSNSTSNFRNFNKLLCSPNNIMRQFEDRFRYNRIYEYFLNINQPSIENTTKVYQPINTIPSQYRYTGIIFNNGKYFLTTEYGLYISENLEDWIRHSQLTQSCQCIYQYKDYIIIGCLNGNLHISYDNGETFIETNIGSEHLLTITCTTEGTIDYTYVSGSNGSIYKVNLQSRIKIFTKSIGIGKSVRSLINHNGNIIYSGYNALGKLTYSGTITYGDNSNLTLSGNNPAYAVYSSLNSTPNGIYAIHEANNVIFSTDGISWIEIELEYGIDPRRMIYNPTKNEFMFGCSNDLEFLRVPNYEFQNVTLDSKDTRYKINGSTYSVADIIWDEINSRYILITENGSILNYKIN